MRTVTFLRHCESKHNIDREYNHHDPPLSDKGREEALKIKGKFDLVLCSPLSRAKETLYLSQIEYIKC